MINIQQISVGEFLAVNCYVVTDEKTGKTAVIDPGGYDNQLDSVLSSVGFENIEYILLTHGHFDHIGGVEKLLSKTNSNAKIAVYKSETALLNDPRRNLSIPFTGIQSAEQIKPDIMLSDGDEITLGESKFTVMHTPGHTSGSVCYICGGDIFSGDTLFRRSAGRTDFPTGSLKELMASLRKIAALDGDYMIHPGHDQETTLEEERNGNPYLGGSGYGFV